MWNCIHIETPKCQCSDLFTSLFFYSCVTYSILNWGRTKFALFRQNKAVTPFNFNDTPGHFLVYLPIFCILIYLKF